MRYVLFVPLMSFGCDVVFGLKTRDAGEVDARVIPPPTCFAPGDVVELPLLADTYLKAGDPAHGKDPIARIGNGGVLLARFDPGDVKFNVFELILSHPGSAVGCDGSDGCSMCPLGEKGTMAVFLTRPDWDERAATFDVRVPGNAWSGPGATGADRSARLTTAPYMGSDLRASAFSLSAGVDPSWMTSLSILIAADAAPTAGAFGTREGASMCDQAPRPKVTVTCTAASSCGNDAMEPPEDCDDGNNVGGDGCSSACRFERCGNGFVDVGEDCDDGNLTSGDGCDAACTCENACFS